MGIVLFCPYVNTEEQEENLALMLTLNSVITLNHVFVCCLFSIIFYRLKLSELIYLFDDTNIMVIFSAPDSYYIVFRYILESIFKVRVSVCGSQIAQAFGYG